jgi:hypothetical protein
VTTTSHPTRLFIHPSRQLFSLSFTALSLISLAALPAHAQYVAWVRQFGTSGVDGYWGVSADSLGQIYAVGDTGGSVFGTQQGNGDVLMVKYDSNGNQLGGFQDGTTSSDRLYVASADGAGGVFVAGNTSSGTFGPPATGSGDNVYGYISPANTWTWLKQSASDSVSFGDSQATGSLLTTGAAGGSVAGPYAGGGGDVLFQVRNPAGTVTLQRQFGSSAFDGGNAATVDGSGNFLIAGVTSGSLGGPNAGLGDAFLAKYDSSGNQLWIKQFGTPTADAATSVATDFVGNIYVAGVTDGSLGGPNAGSTDNFIAKYDPFGNQLWLKQFGTSALEGNPYIAHFLGAVWLTSTTNGSLFGPNLGSSDAFAARLDAASGNVLWSTQIGTANAEQVLAAAIDPFLGRLYIAGITNGSFGGPWAGSDDAMLISINAVPPVPEAATWQLLLLASLCIALFRYRIQFAGSSI